MSLSQYVKIRTGAVLSRLSALEQRDRRKVQAITLKSLSVEGQINATATESVELSEGIKENYFVKNGDIITRLTAPYTAAVITEEHVGKIASSHFAVIRCKENIEPWYLCWWLKQNSRLLHREARGDILLGTISVDVLESLPFQPIDIKKQRKIGELFRLTRREQELGKLLHRLRESLLSGVAHKLK